MNELQNIIKRKQLIDIDLTPNADEVYSGRCLAANYEIVMLLNFDEENGEFDGFTILRNKDVEKYRIWDEDEYSDLKNDNSSDFLSDIDTNDFQDLAGSLKRLTSEFVAIFIYGEEDDFVVGKVLSVEKDSVELHLVDIDAKWNDIEVIKLEDISYVGFNTEYEREIKEKLENPIK